jgi:hypothetical protein
LGDAGEQEPPALEQRLQTLVELERGSRDLLEQREANRQATEKAEAERRLAEVEAALEEAQARRHEHAEARHKLARFDDALAEAWSEVKRMTGEIAEAKRQAEAARREIKPRSERRVAEVQQALAEARAEAEQERDQAELRIAELEELLAEAESAATEAHVGMRRERAERNRERKRLLAIEQQLQALVAPGDSAPPMPEHGQGDLESLIPEPPMPPQGETEPPTFEPGEATWEGLSDVSQDQAGGGARRGGPARRIGRRGRRKWREQTAACVVCETTAEWHSPSALKASGWVITDGAAVCPDCKGSGWQLPDGKGLPFRRSPEKQTSS